MSLTRIIVNGKIQQCTCGGVGAPVGLTVFKTAGGSLGAVPGGFDSHTPLPGTIVELLCAVFLPMVLQVLQDYASLFALQNYASPGLYIKIHSRILRFSSVFYPLGFAESAKPRLPTSCRQKNIQLS